MYLRGAKNITIKYFNTHNVWCGISTRAPTSIFMALDPSLSVPLYITFVLLVFTVVSHAHKLLLVILLILYFSATIISFTIEIIIWRSLQCYSCSTLFLIDSTDQDWSPSNFFLSRFVFEVWMMRTIPAANSPYEIRSWRVRITLSSSSL